MHADTAGVVLLRQPTLVSNCLFEACDWSTQGRSLSHADLLCTLAVILRGTEEQRLRLLFSIYDVPRTGVLTLDDVARVLNAVYGRDEEIAQQLRSAIHRLFGDPYRLVRVYWCLLSTYIHGR